MLHSKTIGTGTDLVLLHGWGFSSALFNDLIQRYQNQYRITTIDLPGHGNNADVDGGLNQWSDEIIKILPKNPLLLGWSLGGLLAINIAYKIPISKLILVATTPCFVKTDNWAYGININNFIQFAHTVKLDPAKSLKHFASLQGCNKSQIKKINHYIDQYPISPNALNQGLQILLNNNLSTTLTKLSIPIKAILGEDDLLISNQITTWYEDLNIQTSTLKTGHMPFLNNDFLL